MRNTVSLTDITHEHTVVAAVFGSNVRAQDAVDFITGIVEDRLSVTSAYDWENYVDRNWDLSDAEVRSLERVIKKLRDKAARHLNKTNDSEYAIFKVISSNDDTGVARLIIATTGDRRIEEWKELQESKADKLEILKEETEVYRPLTVAGVEKEQRRVEVYAKCGDAIHSDLRSHLSSCVRRARNLSVATYGDHTSLTDSEHVAQYRLLDRAASEARSDLLKQFNQNRKKMGLPAVKSFEEDFYSDEPPVKHKVFDHAKAASESSRSH